MLIPTEKKKKKTVVLEVNEKTDWYEKTPLPRKWEAKRNNEVKMKTTKSYEKLKKQF